MNDYEDAIYLLDINDDNNEWKKLEHIKCPIKSHYVTALTADKHEVHLFLGNNEKSIRGHYKLPLLKF